MIQPDKDRGARGAALLGQIRCQTANSQKYAPFDALQVKANVLGDKVADMASQKDVDCTASVQL